MRTITQREPAARFKAVLDDVEAGEVYPITRNGAEIAELRLTWRNAPPFDGVLMRAEADEPFGTEDRVADDTAPWRRR